MNKKQKNRKIVTQNNRNRMINRRYITTMRTLSKLLLKTIKKVSSVETIENKSLFTEIQNILNKFYSILDKAVKKGVIHKNKAARKKARVMKFINHNIKSLENPLNS